MKKFYKDPEAEVIEMEASMTVFTVLSPQDETLENFDDGDGDDIGNL